MLFMHTWEKVLSGEKVQTSRLWKNNWHFQDNIVYLTQEISERTLFAYRKQYYVGQILSVQKARGTKGIARIRVLELARRDVRGFTDEDIAREGFADRVSFFRVWYGMHFPAYLKLLADGYVDYDWWIDSTKGQIPEKNVVVIKFELVK